MRFLKLYRILLLLTAILPHAGVTQETTTGNRPQVYQVEIILFRYTDPTRSSTEALSVPDSAISQTQSDGSASDAQSAVDVSLSQAMGGRLPVDAESQRLGNVSRRLSTSGTYKVLAHRSWLQLVASQSNAKILSLTDLDIEPNTASGQLQLYQKQFLYLAPEIRLGGVYSATTPTITGVRKMPLGKAVYFDHPQFGLIAMITRSDFEWPAE